MNQAAKTWQCSWCGRPSHAPAPNELITCPDCGTQGVLENSRPTSAQFYLVRFFGMYIFMGLN